MPPDKYSDLAKAVMQTQHIEQQRRRQQEELNRILATLQQATQQAEAQNPPAGNQATPEQGEVSGAEGKEKKQ